MVTTAKGYRAPAGGRNCPLFTPIEQLKTFFLVNGKNTEKISKSNSRIWRRDGYNGEGLPCAGGDANVRCVSFLDERCGRRRGHSHYSSVRCSESEASDATCWPKRKLSWNGHFVQLEIFKQMIRTEGLNSLYLGIAPALTRSVLYGGLRLGLYEPCKNVCDYIFGSTNFAFKFVSGVVSGAIATGLTNPTEVLKVRLQMNSKTSPLKELRGIIAEEGIRALWKGVGPAMVRAGCLTASQMATYDESKQVLLKWTPLKEDINLHLISSCIAGTVSTLVTAPIDMIKTRLMLQHGSRGGSMYKNGFHCAYKVVVTEGFGSLYKGGFATFARLGPQTIITFLLCEKLRELAGMHAI